MATYRMQARDSVSGALVTWTHTAPDFEGAQYPGPGTPSEVAVTLAPGGGGGGGVAELPASTADGSALFRDLVGDAYFRPITQDDIQAGYSVSLALASGDSGAIEVGKTWTPRFNITHLPDATGVTACDITDLSTTESRLGVSNPVEAPQPSYDGGIGGGKMVSVTATRNGVTKTSNAIDIAWAPLCFFGVGYGNAGAGPDRSVTGTTLTLDVGSGAETVLSGQLRLSRAGTFSVTPSSQKVYFLAPPVFGTPTFKDQNGFTFAMTKTRTVSVTNQFGFTTDYDVYESDNYLDAAYTVTES